MRQPGVEPATLGSRVRHANHHTTKTPIFWELRYEKQENGMKGCAVELKVGKLAWVLADLVAL